ncbi:MAG: aminodeoxychorismate synthase component I [Armatimonadetes bacterium]|nr:aminodeoxychorismate synthase component I [Armatimonadota bacterium]MDW8122384.1 aminodeoxychorismate synthase component I [Armatimonadota bacterium]
MVRPVTGQWGWVPNQLEDLYRVLPKLNLRHLVILDSQWEPNDNPRYRLSQRSFIAFDPFAVLRAKGQRALVRWWNGRWNQGSTLTLLDQMTRDLWRSAPRGSLPTPLPAGAIGFFGYDLKSLLEPVGSDLPSDFALPDLWLAFYDTVITVDDFSGNLLISSTGLPMEGQEGAQRARERLQEVETVLSRAVCLMDDSGSDRLLEEPVKEVAATSNFTGNQYRRSVERVKAYISAGDIYQACLAQRFLVPCARDPMDLFLYLRQKNPSPFAAYLDGGDFWVISASPERFLHYDPTARYIHTRPIKGTRPRGKDGEEERRMRDQLLSSEKDRAEHIMIVDLERNDLGRVAETGSVWVPELCLLETFPTVFHLTSTVEGRLKEGVGLVDLLRATFPGGSVTGAPKIRAMQIIEEVETVSRSVYTGAIGYLSVTGHLDLSMAIRILILCNGMASFYAGSAIVADSNPEEEYEETLVKARALMNALGQQGVPSLSQNSLLGAGGKESLPW